MSGLKQDLIAKATRDLSKLVRVKRVVHKNGKTFTQSFYIRPDQVKPTDRILGNKAVLDAYLKTKTPLTSLTKDLIDQVNAEVDTKGKLELLKNSLGKENTMNYFQKLGVTWKEDTDPRINWMRVNTSLQKYLKGGGTLEPFKATLTLDDTPLTHPKDDKKADTKDDKSDDKLEDSKLEDTHELANTQQKKNMIPFINKIEDVEVLEKCIQVGMVPEDGVAQDFITNKLAHHHK